jgi:hypothetical protein
MTISTARKHARYRCDLKLCVRYQVNGQQFIISGRCRVIGKGGIGAQLPAELAIGQETFLEISLGQMPAPRRFKAEVRNIEQVAGAGKIHGFQFKEVDERSTAVLNVLFRPDALVPPPKVMDAI